MKAVIQTSTWSLIYICT